MNKRTYFAMVTVAAVLIAAVLAFFWPEHGPGPVVMAPDSGSRTTMDSVTQQDMAARDDDARRARTAAAYEELTTSRRELQRVLGDLESRVWGLELPAEQARAVSQKMMSAQFLLKNPPQLGAFSDVEGVLAEKVRVDAARTQLGEVSQLLGTDSLSTP